MDNQIQMKTAGKTQVADFKARRLIPFCLMVVSLLITVTARAQDGNAGINSANEQVRSYFAAGTQLMYAIGALLGLIGAVKVYQKWNSGDPDTGKVAAAWFGSCVFLVVVATVIKSFFAV
jgi:cytochrome bd-type quinol oxidase subunit 2